MLQEWLRHVDSWPGRSAVPWVQTELPSFELRSTVCVMLFRSIRMDWSRKDALVCLLSPWWQEQEQQQQQQQVKSSQVSILYAHNA